VYGVYWLGWSVATAVALYWCENVIAIVLISLRFLLHRAITHKRGHSRGVLKGFISSAGIFTAFHGLFIVMIVFVAIPNMAPEEKLDPQTFKIGLMAIGATMLLQFLFDVARMKNMPFLKLRLISDSFMSRVLVTHLTIIFGMFAMLIFGHPKAFFAVFASLKLLTDLARLNPSEELPAEPPQLALKMFKSTGRQKELVEKWHRDREANLKRIADDELTTA
jgi:uncharacterized protein DUF6498